MQIKVIALLATVTLLAGCAGTPPKLGVINGQLTACPATPNCVSSQAEDPAQQVAPLLITGTPAQVQTQLLRVLGTLDRTKVVVSEPDYIAAEVTSRVFRFVDDVEFYFPATAATGAEMVVQVRSASRLGHSDLGVNRERVELIRSQLKMVQAQ